MAQVGIIMGSDSDMPVMKEAISINIDSGHIIFKFKNVW